MRRGALIFAVIASLLAPVQALGAIGIGCDGMRAIGSCCCPTASAENQEDHEPTSTMTGLCCCDIQPVSANSTAPLAIATTSAPAAPAGPVAIGDAPAPKSKNPTVLHATTRAPPEATSTLFAQQISLLL